MKTSEKLRKKSSNLVNTINCVIHVERVRSEFDIFKFDKITKVAHFPYKKLDGLPKCAITDQRYCVYLIAPKGTISQAYLDSLKITDYKVSIVDIESVAKYTSSLVNLFLNLYGSHILPRSKNNSKISSIYGEFFYPIGHSKDPNCRYVLRFKYFKGLKIEVKSFKRGKYRNDIQYFWDDISLVPTRKYDKNDSDETCWIGRGNSKEKHLANFLSLDDYDSMQESKIGALFDVLSGYNESLGEYVEFHLNELSADKEIIYNLNENKKTFLKKAKEHFKNQKINIVDYVNSKGSKLFINNFECLLENEIEGITFSNIGVPQEGINISLTKDADYYKKNESDPYNFFCDKHIVQNLTEQSFMSNQGNPQKGILYNSIYLKILQELMVKEEIYQEQSIFELISREKINNAYKFITFHEDSVVISQVANDGVIKFKCVSSDFFFKQDTSLIKELYNLGINKNNKKIAECIFYDSENNLNVIVKLDIYEIPRLKGVKERLSLSNGQKKVNVIKLIDDVSMFESSDNLLKQQVDWESLIEELSLITSDKISLISYRKILKGYGITGQTKVGKLYNQFLLERNTEYIIFSNNRGKEFKDNYSPLCGNHFFEYIEGIDNIIYLPDKKKVLINHEFYSVAENSSAIKRTYAKGYPIREIRSNGIGFTPEFNKWLSGMFDVDFIRINEATVLPFPVKFNREYYNMMKKKNRKK